MSDKVYTLYIDKGALYDLYFQDAIGYCRPCKEFILGTGLSLSMHKDCYGKNNESWEEKLREELEVYRKEFYEKTQDSEGQE